MTTGTVPATIVVDANDRASRTLNRLGQGTLKNLKGTIVSVGKSMFGLTALIGGLGLSIGLIVTQGKKWLENMRGTAQAAAKLQGNLMTMGFSSEAAASRIGDLRAALSGAAFRDLPGLDKALKTTLSNFSPDQLAMVNDLRDKLVKLGTDPKKALEIAIDLVNQYAGSFNTLFETLLDPEGAIAKINADLKTQFDNLTPLLQAWETFIAALAGIGPAIAAVATALATPFVEAIRGMLTAAADILSGDKSTIASAIVTAFVNSMNPTGPVSGFIKDALIGGIAGAVTGALEFMQERGVQLAAFLSLGMVQGMTGEGFSFKTLLGAVIKRVVTLVLNLPEFFKEKGKGIALSIGKGLRDYIIGPFKPLFQTDLASTILGVLGQVAAWGSETAVGMGKAIVTGLWTGIQSLAGWIKEKALSFGRDIFNAVKEGLGQLWPFSPSEAGVKIGEGLILGISKGLSTTRATLDTAVNNMANQLSPANVTAGGGSGGMGHPVTIQLGDQTLARLVMDAVNGEIRIREPGLELG